MQISLATTWIDIVSMFNFVTAQLPGAVEYTECIFAEG